MKLALFCFGILLGCTVAAPARAASFEVGGWIPYWQEASGTGDVLPHLGQLSAVYPFVFGVGSDGTIIQNANLSNGLWKAFIAAAQKQRVRVIPTVMWGDGASMQAILSDTTARIALEDAITLLVKQNNYDGIDIDFEGKQSATREYFSTFLRGLYARMGNKWVYCTIETDPKANDFSALNKYCDRVQVMAYDQGAADASLNRARAAPYMPVADPAWAEKVMTLAAQTIPKKKLILGIPTYGYEYQMTPIVGRGTRFDLLWAFNPAYAMQTAAQYRSTPKRNSAGEMSVTYTPTAAPDLSSVTSVPIKANEPVKIATSVYSQAATAGELIDSPHLLWWSDAQAVADKVALAHKLGVRGVAVFKFDGGEDQGMWSILK